MYNIKRKKIAIYQRSIRFHQIYVFPLKAKSDRIIRIGVEEDTPFKKYIAYIPSPVDVLTGERTLKRAPVPPPRPLPRPPPLPSLIIPWIYIKLK